MIWQILIATIFDRADQFARLKEELERQINKLGLQEEIGILFDCDNREKTIGQKRQDLLERSTSEFLNWFDDDDWPYDYYVSEIYEALKQKPDSVGFLIDMTTNLSNHQTCCHSLKYKVWEDKKDGYDYVRNVTHFNTCKRSIAIQVGFPNLRYAEDRPYSDGVTALCKTEVFINKPLFHYRYSNKIPHTTKYGLNK